MNGRGSLLRRSCSQVTSSKPPPPTRRTPSVISTDTSEQGDNVSQSNTTTPRGSMEFLPPPPPHLLHSDEEETGDQESVSRSRLSVAESIKELQRHGQRQSQPSPGTLRRVQSMSGPPGHPGHHASPDRHNIMAKLNTALSSPRGPRPVSPRHGGAENKSHVSQDQIYAPVAALQQKIQQQQQARMQQQHLEPGLMPHPPGPALNQSTFASPKSKQNSNQSESSEEYGFGMQFQQQSNNFYQQKQQHHPHYPQQPRVHYPPQGQGHPPQHQPGQVHPQQQQHHYPHHDQIMSDMDPTLSQRPLPPNIQPGGGWPQNGGVQRGGGGGMDPAAAKVRQWIETRTVSDVRKVRPVLNQEIQQGFQLRKAVGVKDRSQPRF